MAYNFQKTPKITPDAQLPTVIAIENRIKILQENGNNDVVTAARIRALKARLPKDPMKQVECGERQNAYLLAGKIERDGKGV